MALSLVCLAGGTLAMVSCAQDDLTGEKWDNGVYNTQLETPSADNINYSLSTDGTYQTISWPLVEGAGGYHAVLTNTDNGEVLKDTIVKDTTFMASGAEDTNYQIALTVLANEDHHNAGGSEVVKIYNTFTASNGSIPAGTDLYQYFTENGFPEEALTSMYVYDLEPGGEYTISQTLDFTDYQVTLRSTSSVNHSKVTITGSDVSIKTGTMMTLKNLDVDASATDDPLIQLSSTPNESLKGATGSGDYYNIQGSIILTNCNFEGVQNNFIYDGNVKYCVETLSINNCVVHLKSSSATNISGNAVIYFKAGFPNTLSINKSTFWNNGDSDAKYFVQFSNSARASRAGYTKNYINYTNSTFYNIAKSGQWGNYSSYSGQQSSCWTMTNCIFVDCGNKQIVRRFLGGRPYSTYATISIANNTYMFKGEFESTGGSVENYDPTGTAIEVDPGFADPANGDFTVSGAPQIEKQTGDPRWLPTAE